MGLYNLIKIADKIQMSLDIPDVELEKAEKSVKYYEHLIKKLNAFNKYLDNLYNPFKDYSEVSEESVLKNRAAIRRFRDKVQDNFKEIKKISLYCISSLNYFSSDTHISELIKSFISEMDEIDDMVKRLLKILDDWDVNNYKDHVIKGIESVKKQIAQLINIIEDRILNHINDNILAKTWVEPTTKDFDIEIEEKQPIMQQLNDKRDERG